MEAYIDEKISAGEQIDLKLVKEPIEIANWISTYTRDQAEHAKEILGTDSLNKPLTSGKKKAKVVNFDDYTQKIDEKEAKIQALQDQLHKTQLSGALVNPQGRKLNLGLIDIKYP